MRRAVLVALLVMLAGNASAATWSFTPPEGWTRDAKQSTALAKLMGAQPGIDARVFVREDDPEVLLYAAHWSVSLYDGPSTLIGFANLELDKINKGEGTAYRVVSRAVTPDGDRAIGDVVLEAPEERVHIRLAVLREHDFGEVAFAECRGPAAKLAACERALASLAIEPGDYSRPVDAGPILTTALFVIAGVVGPAGLLIGIGMWRRRVLARRRTPLVDNELVTLTGVVRVLGDPQIAPLSGKSCVLHRSRARVFDARGSLVEEPVRMVATPFAIDTPSGRVILDESPALDVVPSAPVPRAEAREVAFLARAGYGASFHREAGFDEIVLEPGATIVVRGMIRIELDTASTAERGYRDDAPTIVRLVSTPQAPLTISQIW